MRNSSVPQFFYLYHTTAEYNLPTMLLMQCRCLSLIFATCTALDCPACPPDHNLPPAQQLPPRAESRKNVLFRSAVPSSSFGSADGGQWCCYTYATIIIINSNTHSQQGQLQCGSVRPVVVFCCNSVCNLSTKHVLHPPPPIQFISQLQKQEDEGSGILLSPIPPMICRVVV